jgi:site-specific recombinase XerD
MVLAEQATARNQAILWVLAETGMRTAELCGLCISDVDRERGRIRVKGKRSKPRWVELKQEGRRSLLVYLDQYRLKAVQGGKGRRVGEEPLFVSEAECPLRTNGIELLFGRLRRRVGMTRRECGPTLLRDSFAVRYLQAGGDLFTLRELLGQEESARVKRALHMSKEVMEDQKHKKCSGEAAPVLHVH